MIIVIAKGIRKPNAKLQGQIELPCLTNIDFTSGNQKKLTGALIKNSYPKIRTNLKASDTTIRILGLIKEFVCFSETDLDLWSVLKESLDFLEKALEKTKISPLVEFFFVAYLIKNLGFEPELKEESKGDFMANKQTLRSLKILFNLDLNEIIKKELVEPILNQKENISKFFKQYLKYIKNTYLK